MPSAVRDRIRDDLAVLLSDLYMIKVMLCPIYLDSTDMVISIKTFVLCYVMLVGIVVDPKPCFLIIISMVRENHCMTVCGTF